MPSERKAQHKLGEAFKFHNDATQSAAEEWFNVLRLQPELSTIDREPTPGKIVFNLGQEGLTKNSLARGTEENANLIYGTAMYDIKPAMLGTQIAQKRVLQHLRTGWYLICSLPAPVVVCTLR